MSFIDKLTANVTNAGRVVSQKTKNFSEANTLTNEQRTEKRNIQETMNEIARRYFEKYKDDPNAEFAELIASIKASERHIEQLQTQIELIRAREPELVPVPQEIREPKAQRTPTAMVCMNCGRSYPTGVSHCQNCGNELIPQHGSFKNAQKAAETAPQTVAEPWYSSEAPEADKPVQDATDAEAEKSGSAPAETETHFCPYCGKSCESGQAFCANCGKKL